MGIRVFSGLECDILKDGAMDLANDALAELDFVIGSVHSHMNLETAEMTDRLLRALECPSLRRAGASDRAHCCCIATRSRSISSASWTRRCGAGVWLEINASPERLDLSAKMIRTAKARGARFVISTDAHHPKSLRSMRYGVITGAARLAGAVRML